MQSGCAASGRGRWGCRRCGLLWEVGSGDVPGGAHGADDGAGGHALPDGADAMAGLRGVVEHGAIGGGEGGEVAVGAGVGAYVPAVMADGGAGGEVESRPFSTSPVSPKRR